MQVEKQNVEIILIKSRFNKKDIPIRDKGIKAGFITENSRRAVYKNFFRKSHEETENFTTDISLRIRMDKRNNGTNYETHNLFEMAKSPIYLETFQ